MTPVSAPTSEAALEELLSRPTDGVVEALRSCPGDVVILGAGGKMGPTLARMVRRAADAAGEARTVVAVSRFSSGVVAEVLEEQGVTVVRADLSDTGAIAGLPDAPNVIYMAGQKFGTSRRPEMTWHTNVVMPARVAARYDGARIVAFSTGNVYALTAPASGGSRESDPVSPVGEYAMSCVGRERVFEYAAAVGNAMVSSIRLNYAVDLRYGVIVDIARKVQNDEAVGLDMGWFNCIWQRDANAMAISALRLASRPATVLNVTGPELLSVREVANSLAVLMGKSARFSGTEGTDALLSNVDRMLSIFGAPSVSATTLIDWVAEWVGRGDMSLGRPTHFEQRGGVF